MRLLIVEDNTFQATILKRQLKNLGYEDVTGATSGEEALRHIRRQTFDLIITDWRMRGLSGLGFVQRTRAFKGREHTPIIMLTSKGLPEDVLAARMAGVDDYIVKPVVLEVLEAKIAKVLAGAGGG